MPLVARTTEKQSALLPRRPSPPPVCSVGGEQQLSVPPLMRPVSPHTREALYQDSSHHVRITLTVKLSFIKLTFKYKYHHFCFQWKAPEFFEVSEC